MGTRGRDEHHKLRFGDFSVKSTTDRHEYVEFTAEQGTKTISGETEKSTNGNARSFKPTSLLTKVGIDKSFCQEDDDSDTVLGKRP